MKKPLYHTKVWYEVSEAVELLAVERKILEFLHKDSVSHMDEVKPITQQNLFEFWKRVQERKDSMTDVKRAKDEEETRWRKKIGNSDNSEK